MRTIVVSDEEFETLQSAVQDSIYYRIGDNELNDEENDETDVEFAKKYIELRDLLELGEGAKPA